MLKSNKDPRKHLTWLDPPPSLMTVSTAVLPPDPVLIPSPSSPPFFFSGGAARVAELPGSLGRFWPDITHRRQDLTVEQGERQTPSQSIHNQKSSQKYWMIIKCRASVLLLNCVKINGLYTVDVEQRNSLTIKRIKKSGKIPWRNVHILKLYFKTGLGLHLHLVDAFIQSDLQMRTMEAIKINTCKVFLFVCEFYNK